MSHTRGRTSRRAAGHREERRTPREAPDGARDRGGAVRAGEPRLRRAGLFDIRTFIAMLLGIYGVVLVLMGFFGTSQSDLERADGVNVNLWVGLGLLVSAAVFEDGGAGGPSASPRKRRPRTRERTARAAAPGGLTDPAGSRTGGQDSTTVVGSPCTAGIRPSRPAW